MEESAAQGARPDPEGGGPGRKETPEERADRLWDEMLQEVRVCQTGAQILFGPSTVIYRNLRADSVVSDASVTIAVRDHQGIALGTDTSQFKEIPPLGVGVWSGAVTATNGKPLVAELEVREVNRRPTDNRPEQVVPFPIERVRFTAKHDGTWSASGEVANPYPVPLDNLKVIVLARDAAGRLSDSAESFVGQVAPSRSVPFQVSSWGPGKPTKYEIVTLPILFLGGWDVLVADHHS